MRVDVLTLFPKILSGFLSQSILRLATERGLVQVRLHDIRDWATGKHHTVDDAPYGGGPGMVLKVAPVVEAVETVQRQADRAGHVVVLAPQGRRLTQAVVEELARQPRLLLVCGRYEGFDQRVMDILKPDQLSIGDYVLSGGEVAAMVVIDAVARLVPGVLGDTASCQQDSFSNPERLLEHAQYTRPRAYRGHEVPDVLLSGNHGEIDRWRRQQSLDRTDARCRECAQIARAEAP